MTVLICNHCGIEFDALEEGVQISGAIPDEDGNFEPEKWTCDSCAYELGYLDPEERIVE